MSTGPTRIVLATRNSHKVGELQAVLEPLLPNVEVLTVDAFSAEGIVVPDVAETEVTFAGNALLKARAVAAATGVPAIADDSGISVDVLGGAPGIFSARWAGRHGDDAANLALLLAQIADVPAQHRGGAFVCAAALALPDGTCAVREGQLRGSITTAAAGAGGFGYDPIFTPEGAGRTLAEHTAQEKNAISHRGAAFRALAPLVVDALAGRPLTSAPIHG